MGILASCIWKFKLGHFMYLQKHNFICIKWSNIALPNLQLRKYQMSPNLWVVINFFRNLTRELPSLNYYFLWNELYFVSVNDRVAASWQILTFPLDGFNPFSLLFPSLLSEQQQQQRWVSEHWDDQSEFLWSNHCNEFRTILMNAEPF